jgi:hypothetical protein
MYHYVQRNIIKTALLWLNLRKQYSNTLGQVTYRLMTGIFKLSPVPGQNGAYPNIQIFAEISYENLNIMLLAGAHYICQDFQ